MSLRRTKGGAAGGGGAPQSGIPGGGFSGASMHSDENAQGMESGEGHGSSVGGPGGSKDPGGGPGGRGSFAGGPGAGGNLLGLASSFSAALGAGQHGVLGNTLHALPRLQQFLNGGQAFSPAQESSNLHFSLQSMMTGSGVPTAQGGATYNSSRAVHGDKKVDFSAAAMFGSMQGGGMGGDNGQHSGSPEGGQHGGSPGSGIGPTLTMHLSF